MSTSNTAVQLAKNPVGLPKVDDFEVVERPMPELGEGQVLVRSHTLSLDPYMRSQIAGRHISGSIQPGDLMIGETIGEVIESNSADFAVGDQVRGKGGWQTYYAADPSTLAKLDDRLQPPSYALSVLGMPGLTAYAGLIWKAEPKEGDTLLVAAATGAVGSVIVQLAKQRGCRVIGIAGGAEKCRFAEKTLGADACIDRRSEDVAARLDELCPNGIDIYFDLVGGNILELATERLAVGARVILCGLAADYNRVEDTRPAGPPVALFIRSRATVFGLVVFDFEHRRDEFINDCIPLVEAGKLSVREDKVTGLVNAPAAFIGLLEGANFGKVIVEI